MASVSIRRLAKYYGETQAVCGIDIEIADREFVALVGPSGCGKSTTLRMIAGLEDISEGEICIDGVVVNELLPKERDVAMVFQDYALYPHMTVRENMSFGLRIRKLAKAEVNRRVEDAASILGIGHLLDRQPKQLSGGQRQRVAMGRAIVRNPKVFLFDEPLSNLDAKLRVQMRTEIKRLHGRVGATIVYVTHDQVEAMTLASRIVVLKDGVIEQIGTPDTVYNRPASIFVAGFIGSPTMNFIEGRLAEQGGAFVAKAGGDDIIVPLEGLAERAGVAPGTGLTLGIRPEHISLAEGAGGNRFRVDLVEPLGSDTLVHFKLAGADAIARIPPEHAPRAGAWTHLEFDRRHVHLFDARTGLRCETTH